MHIAADRRGGVVPPTEITVPDRESTWRALRAAAAVCRECPLGERATQTVWGEGALAGTLMLVGEQPGDREDIEGKPFVGPAGHLLGRAIDDLGWRRETLYVTNAVKHFKYELRGTRRIHKTPAQLEILACAHWLDSEIESVKPRALVLLGATAAQSLLGRDFKVTEHRGELLDSELAEVVTATIHPSAVLRSNDRERIFASLVDDLRLVTPTLRP